MKNLFKIGFFALAISLSVVACNSNKPAEETTDTTMSDSTMMDSTMMDSTMTDSTMMDSTAAM